MQASEPAGTGPGLLDRFLDWMLGLPDALVYVVVGVFAALENVVPPVPADVIALFGGFLAGIGTPSAWLVFASVWTGNVSSALLLYWVGRRYGLRFFAGRFGRALLQPAQLTRLATFYAIHGAKVIFVSRFLPGFRAVVPVFAGTTGVDLARTAIPIGVASAIWYGLVVYLGATAGRNWAEIRGALEGPGRALALVAAALMAGLAWLWWRSREKEAADDGRRE